MHDGPPAGDADDPNQCAPPGGSNRSATAGRPARRPQIADQRAGSSRHPKGRISPKTASRRRTTESRCWTQRGNDAKYVGNQLFLNSLRTTPQKRGDRRHGRRWRAGARRRRMAQDGSDAGAPRGLRKVPRLLLDLCRGTFFRTLPRPISGPLLHVGCRRHRCAPSPGAEGCRAGLGGPPRSRRPAHASSPRRVRRREAPRSRRRAAPSSSARGPRPLPLLWVVSGRRHHRLHPVSCGGRRRQAAAEGWSPRSRSLSLRCSSSSRLQALFEVSRPRAKRRAANRSRGLCICGTPATPGYRTCVGCRERAAAHRAR